MFKLFRNTMLPVVFVTIAGAGNALDANTISTNTPKIIAENWDYGAPKIYKKKCNEKECFVTGKCPEKVIDSKSSKTAFFYDSTNITSTAPYDPNAEEIIATCGFHQDILVNPTKKQVKDYKLIRPKDSKLIYDSSS